MELSDIANNMQKARDTHINSEISLAKAIPSISFSFTYGCIVAAIEDDHMKALYNASSVPILGGMLLDYFNMKNPKLADRIGNKFISSISNWKAAAAGYGITSAYLRHLKQ